jgi:hypothetical protein
MSNVNAGWGDAPLAVIEHLLASGEIVAAQQPDQRPWSPEKKLAAAVLASALVEIRDHHADPTHRKTVAEDVAWVFSDDGSWPFSFLRLCELFRLDPEYVRSRVRKWLSEPQRRYRLCSAHRHAA